MMKQEYPAPLWQRIGAFDMGPVEIAALLQQLADEVEYRGEIDYDRDPGETADWLRNEAATAKAAAET